MKYLLLAILYLNQVVTWITAFNRLQQQLVFCPLEEVREPRHQDPAFQYLIQIMYSLCENSWSEINVLWLHIKRTQTRSWRHTLRTLLFSTHSHSAKVGLHEKLNCLSFIFFFAGFTPKQHDHTPQKAHETRPLLAWLTAVPRLNNKFLTSTQPLQVFWTSQTANSQTIQFVRSISDRIVCTARFIHSIGTMTGQLIAVASQNQTQTQPQTGGVY